jgi:hypothetical protein
MLPIAKRPGANYNMSLATSEPTEPIKMSKDLFIWLLDMAKRGIVIEDWVKARGPAETNDEGLGGVGAEDSEVLLMISD